MPGQTRGLVVLLALLLLAACTAPGPDQGPGSRGTEVTRRPEWHTVRAGETLYAIARRYGLPVDRLAAWNNLGDGTLIRVGQRLRLSAPSGKAPAAGPSPPPLPVIEAPPRWHWPVNGPVLARFGESPATASGIQLGGREGETIRAAAAGQVVYAGSGLAGYGELLIIKHSANWLTAYGYNQALLVREGDRVGAGQPIARMGNGPAAIGAPRSPALHFEIRRNGAPLDPLAALPASR